MPTQKRLRRHDQPVSAPLRERAGERREEGTIGRPQRGALFLPSEHGELMSQHEQLDVFGDLAAPASGKQAQHSREGEIGEGEQHPLILPEPTAGNAVTSNLRFETPQAETSCITAEDHRVATAMLTAWSTIAFATQRRDARSARR